jgi:hypothetical protein
MFTYRLLSNVTASKVFTKGVTKEKILKHGNITSPLVIGWPGNLCYCVIILIDFVKLI